MGACEPLARQRGTSAVDTKWSAIIHWEASSKKPPSVSEYAVVFYFLEENNKLTPSHSFSSVHLHVMFVHMLAPNALW